jgi:multidrug transporter EmrE-like cation transporter
MSRIQVLLLVVGVCGVGVLADAVLKLASSDANLLRSKWLFIGLGLSIVFAVAWIFLMREMKLATAGVLYGVGSALLLCLIGVCAFNEKLSGSEVAGIAAGALAILLLGRAAE